MDPLTILALANGAIRLGAELYDLAQQAGATPEQIAEARVAAMARFDAAAQAVAAEQPPA